ncbi:MAG: DMT family transporter [Pseudomonadota bacterium]
MSTAHFFFLSGVVGVVAGLYLPLNARLGDQIGSPLLATAVFFVVGALCAVCAWAMVGRAEALPKLIAADQRLLFLGVISFGIILSATYLIPRVGPGAYFVCLVTGQVFAGLALNHFGLFADQQLRLTPLKLFGAAMIIGGVLVIYQVERTQVSAG